MENPEIEKLKERLRHHRDQLKRLHRKGTGGLELVRRNAEFYDEIIRSLFRKAVQDYSGTEIPLAVAAVGGYGSKLLAPYSDIDLLFLVGEGSDPETARSLIEATLYPLWDMKLEVGHATRAVSDQAYLLLHDPAVLTASLDARFLAGDRSTFDELLHLMNAYIDSGRIKPRIPRKTEPGMEDYPIASVTVLEPNVKESPGGLRDYQHALWTARIACGCRSLEDLQQEGLLNEINGIALRNAIEFLVNLRCELHFITGRRSDTLSIELQREVAGNLGYGRGSDQTAIQGMLRDYYLNARRIYELGRRVQERFCSEPTVEAGRESRELEPGITLGSGGVDLGSEEVLHKDPAIMIRIFVHVAQTGISLSEETRGILADNAHLVNDEFRSGRRAAGSFLEMIGCDHAGLALRQMHELDLLGAYLPEFGALDNLPQYDIHHRFTVDEHTLLTIHFLEQLNVDPPEGVQRLAGLYRRLKRPDLLKLTLLLHDVGKAGGPNHLERSVRIIPGVLQRLGLPETEVQTVLLLVREHLAMSTLAQLRDIHDPKILRRFAQSVGNAEHLTMLYLLTYADMKAVGPGIWNSWKGSLLEELYSRTLDLIIPGGDEQEEDFLERLIAEVSARVAGRPTAELIDDYFQHMPERSFSWLNPSRVVRHLKALLGLTRTRQVSVGISEEPALGALELVVATHDRSGVLWQIAGACATVGVNILGAQVFTRTDGVALDTLQIEPPPQDPDTGMPVMPLVDIETELADKLTAMLTGGSGEPEVAGRDDSGSERQMEMSRRVPVRVKGDNRESQTHSLIQIEALDRLGLLYDVTRTISQSGVNIHLAKINTEANKVIDAFYVNRDGGKLSDAELKALCDKIESAIKAKQ